MQLTQPIDTVPALVPPRNRPPDRRRLLRGLRGGGSPWSTAIAWLMLLYGLGAAALLTLGWLLGDRTWWLFLTNLSLFYWLAPTVVMSAIALVRRWWLVALVSLIGAAVWLATFGPLFVPQRAAATGTMRVATYNISPRPDVEHVARLVERTRPDVLLIQELLPIAQDTLVHAVPALPYHHFAPVNTAAPGGGGTAVLSRLPIVAVRPVEGLPSTSRPIDLVSLDTGQGVVTVVSLHLNSPCAVCVTYRPTLSQLRVLEGESRLRNIETEQVAAALPAGPLLVGGDLNSGTRNVPLRHLQSAGLVDLHRAVGSGPGFTRLRRYGLVRIDWLLASRDITPVREWVERRDGSEHRPVVADVAVPAGAELRGAWFRETRGGPAPPDRTHGPALTRRGTAPPPSTRAWRALRPHRR
jgi:endonuclease/exonuclease/phosphatase (EEP) superfamily protein YafD